MLYFGNSLVFTTHGDCKLDLHGFDRFVNDKKPQLGDCPWSIEYHNYDIVLHPKSEHDKIDEYINWLRVILSEYLKLPSRPDLEPCNQLGYRHDYGYAILTILYKPLRIQIIDTIYRMVRTDVSVVEYEI